MVKYASISLLFIILIPFLILIFIILKRNRLLLKEAKIREKMEEILKKSEARYRKIFENAREGIFQSTADGRLISVNPALARIMGYKNPQAMIEGITGIEYLYLNADERKKILQSINENGFVDNYPVRLKHRNGDILWASLNALVVRDEKGDILYYEGSLEDITKRKEAEDEVRNSRKLINNLLQAASEFSIIGTDPKGIITVFNRGAELMLGYSSEEIIGRHTQLILHDDLEVAARGRELTAKLGYAVEGFRVFSIMPELEGSETREWTYKRKDGSSLPVSLVVSAIRSDSSEITGYLGIATDLTKQKKTEVEIRRLASIVRHSSEMVSLTQLDGQMVFLNDSGSKMLGIDPGDIEKINFMQLMPEHLKDLVENQIFPKVLDGSIWEGDLQCINLKTGAVMDIHSLNFTIDDPSALYKKYLVNVSHDISQRKQAEEKFRNIFMMAPDGISITRMRDGLIIDTNIGFGEISEWERSEVIGRTSLEINFWADPADRAFLVDELKAGRDVIQREFQFRRKDGSLGNGIYSARLIQIGGEACIIFLMQDITRRKETERILRENEERLSSIAMNLPGVVFQFCAMDNGDWTPTYNSQRMTEIFGLTIETAREFTAFLSRVHEEDRERFIASISNAVESCTPWDFEGRFIKPSGEMIWFHGLSIPTRHEGFVMFEGIFLDITARKTAEEMLRLSEEKFTKVFMMAPDVVAITRMKDGLIADVNNGFEEITGWRRSEVIGRTSYSINFWADPEERADMVAELMAGSDVVRREMQFRRKDGTLRTGIYSARFIKIAEEAHLVFVMKDITERKRAEEALRQSEERFSKAFRASPAAIAITDLKTGQHMDANDRYLQLFGCSREELIGHTSMELGIGADRVIRERLTEEFRSKGFVKDLQATLTTRLGETREAFCSTEIINLNGQEAILSLLYDITERKKAEEMSRLSEEKFTKVFMTSPNGIVITRMADGRFMDVNIGFEEMTGWKREELIGRTSLDINFWRDRSKRAFMVDSLEEGKEINYHEFQFRRKDGTVRTGIYSARTIRIAGEECVLFFLQDITEQRRLEDESRKLEQQLSQSQRMDAIGKLAGGIAHDFNNILMGIQGNASMMLMECGPTHPYYQRLSRIEEHVKRGANLTRQLLGFAREGKYEVKTLSANDLLKKGSQIFIETRKEIEAAFELEDDLHPIEADAGQLEQVFLNIFINAGHAMPGGGRLHIKTSNIILQEKDSLVLGIRPGDYVKISISDTGTGMDEKTLEKIFEPFFTTKSERGGTGLGLASAYGIIRNHGGIINAYSEPGQGSTFNIYLPSSDKMVQKERDQAVDKSLFLGSGGILVVDDEPAILELASEILEILGYTVYRAENVQDAVSVYREHREGIKLVILDMILKGASGSQVLRMLKEINPDVKIILSSGYGMQGEVQKVMEMGCVGFIQKPYNFAELSKVVHQTLNQ